MHTFNRFFGLPAIFYSLFNPHTRDIFAYRKRKKKLRIVVDKTDSFLCSTGFVQSFTTASINVCGLSRCIFHKKKVKNYCGSSKPLFCAFVYDGKWWRQTYCFYCWETAALYHLWAIYNLDLKQLLTDAWRLGCEEVEF